MEFWFSLRVFAELALHHFKGKGSAIVTHISPSLLLQGVFPSTDTWTPLHLGNSVTYPPLPFGLVRCYLFCLYFILPSGSRTFFFRSFSFCFVPVDKHNLTQLLLSVNNIFSKKFEFVLPKLFALSNGLDFSEIVEY
jgi:hypothetical protein